jgi:hypothetical protein
MFNGRRQPSRGGTSRMTRECQVRFCEGLGVKFPGPTRQPRPCRNDRYRRKADIGRSGEVRKVPGDIPFRTPPQRAARLVFRNLSLAAYRRQH